MRREERMTVQGPVKKQQPDGLSHGGGGFKFSARGAVWPNHRIFLMGLKIFVNTYFAQFTNIM